MTMTTMIMTTMTTVTMTTMTMTMTMTVPEPEKSKMTGSGNPALISKNIFGNITEASGSSFNKLDPKKVPPIFGTGIEKWFMKGTLCVNLLAGSPDLKPTTPVRCANKGKGPSFNGLPIFVYTSSVGGGLQWRA